MGKQTTNEEIVENSIEKICRGLESPNFMQNIQQALPPEMDVEKYCRIIINAVQMHNKPDIFKNCDITTLFLSCQKAAQDGLLFDGREACLTGFWNKNKKAYDIVYMPMVQGLIKVAENSAKIASVKAFVVYQKHFFEYFPAQHTEPVFKPDWKIPPSELGEPILAYCVVYKIDGNVIGPSILHRERIMKIASKGNNSAYYDPLTGDDWMEWWKKTAIRNVLKFAPKSPQLLRLENHDNFAEGYRFEKDVTPSNVNLQDLKKPNIPQTINSNNQNKVQPKNTEKTNQAVKGSSQSKNKNTEIQQNTFNSFVNGIKIALKDEIEQLGLQIGQCEKNNILTESQITELKDLYLIKKGYLKK